GKLGGPRLGSPWMVSTLLTVAPPGAEPGSIWMTSPFSVVPALTALFRSRKVVTLLTGWVRGTTSRVARSVRSSRGSTYGRQRRSFRPGRRPWRPLVVGPRRTQGPGTEGSQVGRFIVLAPPGTEPDCPAKKLIALCRRKGHQIVRRGAQRAGLHKDSDKGAPNPTRLPTKNPTASQPRLAVRDVLRRGPSGRRATGRWCPRRGSARVATPFQLPLAHLGNLGTAREYGALRRCARRRRLRLRQPRCGEPDCLADTRAANQGRDGHGW